MNLTVLPPIVLRIHFSDPAGLDELQAALGDADCPTIVVGGDTLLVTSPLAVDEDEAHTELLFFLRAWQAHRPELEVALLR